MTEEANREKQIFEQAFDLESAEERQRFLETACGDDTALLARVQVLLQSGNAAEEFLPEHPHSQPHEQLLTEKPGDRIGRYKLLQQIGEGGCGVVYMAEQEEPVRRRVALKVIKLGMDTRQVIARFEAERQALALMDHPNIAKVLDAGATETGRPYFVMELVRGVKITEFCDENNVTTADRLKLFIQVCQAIQHAHQKGVIHRDIKPSNILVSINDGKPLPKVIDFGIAKATAGRLTDHTLFTAFDQFVGTPAYMSPEQAVMTSLDIDTRSDIYSLGVLLYELLVGCTPFDQKELLAVGLDEMRRTIREVEPIKPSTRLTQELSAVASAVSADASSVSGDLARSLRQRTLQVRGDLDWIVMKCLEKERARRYETANEVAADIQRHLDNEPVFARPPSKLYEFQKTVRRHKFGFAAASALFLALMFGALVSTWQAVRATRAEGEQARLRQLAEAKEKKSEQIASFLTQMLEGAGPSVARGRDATILREILEKASGLIQAELANQPEAQGDLWMTLGKTYVDIGDFESATTVHGRAVTCYRQAFPGNHAKLAIALGHLGSAQSYRNLIEEGKMNAGLGLTMARQLKDDETLATCLTRYASSLLPMGQGSAEGVPYLHEALAIRLKLGKPEPIYFIRGRLAHSVTNVYEAEGLAREALAYYIQTHGEEDTSTAGLRLILAQKLLILEKLAEAENEFRQTLHLWRRLLADNHPRREITFRFLIQSLALQRKYQAAEEEISQERRLSPTNGYCVGLEIALKISQGEWSLTPTNMLIVLESNFSTNSVSFNAAIALARTGRMKEYRHCCQALLKRAGEQRDSGSAEQAAKAALLFPCDPITLAVAGSLADFAASPGGSESFMPWALSTKALAEYRRGNFSSAIDFANRARARAGKDFWRSGEATTYCVQALAYASSGDKTNAYAALNSVEQSKANYKEEVVLRSWQLWENDYWVFRDWIMVAILKREAEALLSREPVPSIGSSPDNKSTGTLEGN